MRSKSWRVLVFVAFAISLASVRVSAQGGPYDPED